MSVAIVERCRGSGVIGATAMNTAIAVRQYREQDSDIGEEHDARADDRAARVAQAFP